MVPFLLSLRIIGPFAPQWLLKLSGRGPDRNWHGGQRHFNPLISKHQARSEFDDSGSGYTNIDNLRPLVERLADNGSDVRNPKP